LLDHRTQRPTLLAHLGDPLLNAPSGRQPFHAVRRWNTPDTQCITLDFAASPQQGFDLCEDV
jgi:hypothetical protein